MTWEELREHCLSLPGSTETFPFEPTVSVFKAANGKVFGITTEKAAPVDISVKCDPTVSPLLPGRANGCARRARAAPPRRGRARRASR